MQPITPFAAAGEAAPPAAFARPGVAAFKPSGLLGPVFAWVLETQQACSSGLQAASSGSRPTIRSPEPSPSPCCHFSTAWCMRSGPGHGKTIISSYVVANEKTARRGIIVSFIAAALQAVTAIALVGIFAVLLNAPGVEITAWSNQLETRELRDDRAGRALAPGEPARCDLARLAGEPSPTAHHHARARSCHAQPSPSHAHHHGHTHAEGEACDHMVDPRALSGPFSWRKMMAVVFSVGIRPCTGAILVLVFALTQGVFWAGVAATFAMALGTAITVAILATLALRLARACAQARRGKQQIRDCGMDDLPAWRGGADLPVRRHLIRRLVGSGATILTGLFSYSSTVSASSTVHRPTRLGRQACSLSRVWNVARSTLLKPRLAS